MNAILGETVTWNATTTIDTPSPATTAARLLPTLSDSPGRILVADDEHLTATSLVRSLLQLGHTPLGPARDGEHAIELAFSSHPDLAILDVRMMNETDGIDAAGVLLGEMLIPVIIVSAYSDSRQIAGATHAGVYGYLVKPVTKEQLRAAISIAWHRFTQDRAKNLEASELRSRLENRQVIDQAKWMLVEKLEIDEGSAMRHMRRLAKEKGKTLAQIARELAGPIILT